MKHIIFYSGGLGSWMTAKRVIEKHGKESVLLLFTDTLMEDEDLYRFLVETAGEIYGYDKPELVKMVNNLFGIEDHEQKKKAIIELGKATREAYPNFVWIADGRDIWEVFFDVRYLGNSRTAPCSHILKQKTAKKYITENFRPEECILYLGIDWTEEHRTKAPVKHWAPYTVKFPLCDEPLVDKEDAKRELKKIGIELPRLYKMGFSHNNCGGFCVRAGQGHFATLLEQMPERYFYHEQKEQEIREYLDKDISILRRVRNGEKVNLTLEQLRDELNKKPEQIDLFDIGGCGCFVNDEEGGDFHAKFSSL